ncbi:MAG: class I SAM-dependent RNA methyltransferase, partial [Deltaproteobacteria bacterium]|nr:class I SAM-dependent RNA methyltransferase [Deltaproteobacteria bacterium]
FAPPGNGLGFYQGRAVFVPRAIPGDEVSVRVEKVGKDYILADLEEILTAAAGRRQPPCPHYETCGGCDLLHLHHQDQLRLKEQMLAETLARTGVNLRLDTSFGANEFAYRHRFFLHREGRQLGFLRRRRHQLVPLDHCPLLAPGLSGLLERLASFDLPQDLTGIYGLANQAGDYAASGAAAGRRRLSLPGLSGSLYEDYGSGRLELDAAAFAQCNPAVTARLQADLAGLCRPRAAVVELYGGSGTFSLALAAVAGRVRVYESDAGAVARGRRNAAANKFDNLEFFAAKLGREALPGDCEVLVVDPPRAGLEVEVISEIMASRAESLLYISCNPATLARDLRRLGPAFTPRLLRAYDMYPGTTHLEVLALLER